MREEKEHREGKTAGEEKEYREPPALLALPPPRWIHASCPRSPARPRLRRSPGGRTRAGHREEEARRRVDPLASARRKKPRRDPDCSPGGGFGEEIWGRRRFEERWRNIFTGGLKKERRESGER